MSRKVNLTQHRCLCGTEDGQDLRVLLTETSGISNDLLVDSILNPTSGRAAGEAEITITKRGDSRLDFYLEARCMKVWGVLNQRICTANR